MKLTATDHLHHVLAELVDTGKRPACIDKPDLWLSDDPGDRRIATRLCAGCRVLSECAAAAAEVQAHFGVWAACDRTQAQHSKAAPPSISPQQVNPRAGSGSAGLARQRSARRSLT
jgi:hypothetical protein